MSCDLRLLNILLVIVLSVFDLRLLIILVLSVLWFTYSNYPFGHCIVCLVIYVFWLSFWSLYCLSSIYVFWLSLFCLFCDLRILIILLVIVFSVRGFSSSDYPFGHCIVCLRFTSSNYPFGHCIVCLVIYVFWLSFWSLYCLSCDLRLLIILLVIVLSVLLIYCFWLFFWSLYHLSCDLRLLIIVLIIVSSVLWFTSSNYPFWILKLYLFSDMFQM